MIRTLASAAQSSASLVQAKTQLLLLDTERSLRTQLIRFAAWLMCAVGGGVLLVAAALVLSPLIGWPLTLTILGGGVMGAGGVTLLAVKPSGAGPDGDAPKSRAQLMKEVELYAEALSKALDEMGGGEEEQSSSKMPPMMGVVIDAVTKHPDAVVGAAFAALSVLGPGRALRAAGKAASAADAAASLLRAVRTLVPEWGPVRPRESAPAENGQAAPPPAADAPRSPG